MIGLSSFIVYDKVLNKNNTKEHEKNNEITDNENNNNPNNNNTEESEHVELEDNLKKELTDVFEFVYDYYDWGNAYCGSYNVDDRIMPTDSSSIANHYTASSKYNSYDEMIKYLKSKIRVKRL